MLTKIYEASKLIGDAYAEQTKKMANAEEANRYFIHKLNHTFAVYSVILDIMIREKTIAPYLTEEVRELISLSAILHDIGRFYQFDENGNHIPNNIFHHAQKSVDIIKTNPRFNNPMLLFAIQSHDLIEIDYTSEYYTNLSDKDKKIADIMAKLLRDADKFENMRNYVLNGSPSLVKGTVGPLSDDIKTFIKNKQSANRDFVKTAADTVASCMLWVNNIYFDETRKMINDINYIETLINIFIKCGASNDDVALVREMVKV